MSVVIPTRFERLTLIPLVEAARQVGRVVVVHTEQGHADLVGVRNVHDYRRNIQHWWNSGLDACEGPALVLNDDLEATPDALRSLLTALEDADLVYVPGRSKKAATPISGWCFGVQPDLRPDPAFVWWCGDDDLYKRASRPALVDAPIVHVDRGDFGPPDEFREAVIADRALYAERWS